MSMLEKFTPTKVEEDWFTKGMIKTRLKIGQLFDEGREIWWRRGDFHRYDNKPMWHLLTDREIVLNQTTSIKTEARYTALCGYYKDFNEMVLGEEPRFKITRPKVIERCNRCVKKFNELEQTNGKETTD